MQSVLAKKWKCTQNEKKRHVKLIWYPRKNETVVLRIIYKSTLNVPTTPVACSGTSSSVKRSENWSHPITSIGLGRKTTTTTVMHVLFVLRVCNSDGNAGVGSGGGVVAVSVCMGGTHGSGVLYSTCDVLEMSVVRGVCGVCDMCMCLARCGVGGEGVEWMR